MKAYLMQPYSNNSTVLAVVAGLLGTLQIAHVPSEFYSQLIALFTVPDEVKIGVAPFLGSAVATAVEYLAFTNSSPTEKKAALYWPIKIFVGWVAGAFGGPALDAVIKASPQALAFWSGIGGYGSVVLFLAIQKKEVKKQNDDV